MNIQIFGVKKNADTRKAQRFFSERRVPFHFVDLVQRPASRGELRRFVQKFGAESLLNRESRRFRDLGLGAAHLDDRRILRLLEEEPMLLVMPLVRNENRLTVGDASDEWKSWID